ncbi:phosphatase domain-containing protein [uncultured Jannaschia sp.]|uniref:phosphatase domain-containing protein n=1 Tax=uncultured Jannaschia sp. TaxID=293347 RepID=UPI0026170663|nr:phosphatase domain-containing protein [uncultured Jannaschia sp.]
MIRSIALSIARRAERLLERIGARSDADAVLDAYCGYATPDALILRGRVLSHLRATKPDPTQSRWDNLRHMASLFLTDEVANVPVQGGGARAISDAEGYVALSVDPRAADFAAGSAWAGVPVRIEGRPETEVAFPVRLPTPRARHIVVSDIDDTMIETGAHNLARNLWTTFTGSPFTRMVHRDAVRLMRRLTADGRNPVFYVSSSPWNLHRFLDALFARNDVPRGPMFLRDLGLTAEGIGASHGSHKGAAIDAILAANPDLPAFLMGDTGQRDAVIYRDAIRRHPGRIAGVALREPVPGAGANDAAAIAAIEAAGVPCWHGPDFDGALAHWAFDEEAT